MMSPLGKCGEMVKTLRRKDRVNSKINRQIPMRFQPREDSAWNVVEEPEASLHHRGGKEKEKKSSENDP